jgi:hypothetical protein
MSSSKSNLSWVIRQQKKIKEEYGIESKLLQNGHLKITFYRGTISFMWVVSSTPSDINSRKKSLSQLRNGIREKFGIDIDKSCFTLQLVRCTSFSPPRI